LLRNAAVELPAEQRVLLALDDYHLITAPAIQQQLGFLLDHLPPQLRIVILTRAAPPLALPRRRARSELSEFRTADLRFSLCEITAFCQQIAGLSLAPPVVAALEQRSEGWIASLQLAALALETDPAGSAERLADLLAVQADGQLAVRSSGGSRQVGVGWRSSVSCDICNGGSRAAVTRRRKLN
jgi:ATP/maltotriose-dependent transcriptional regulator MalT